VAVKDRAPGAFAAAWLGVVLTVADGWFIAWFFLVWQIVLFLALGQAFAAYGGAMALAALVGAALGLLLGRHVDMGHGRRAVLIAGVGGDGGDGPARDQRRITLAGGGGQCDGAAGVLAGHPGVPLGDLQPGQGLALPDEVPDRRRGGWDIGCGGACLVGAALATTALPLSVTVLLGLPAVAGSAWLLRRYYARESAAAAARPLS